PERPREEDRKDQGDRDEGSVRTVPERERDPVTGQAPDRSCDPCSPFRRDEPASNEHQIPPGELRVLPPDQTDSDGGAELENRPQLGQGADAELRVVDNRKNGRGDSISV